MTEDNKEETVWEAFDRILAEHPDFKLPPNFPHPLPWRKPTEKPDVDEDVLLSIHWRRCIGYYNGLGKWHVFGGGDFDDNEIQGWLYANEIPLPEWVQK